MAAASIVEFPVSKAAAVRTLDESERFEEFEKYMRNTTAYFIRSYANTLPGAADVGCALNDIFKACEKYVADNDMKNFMNLYERCMFTVGRKIAMLRHEDYPSSYNAHVASRKPVEMPRTSHIRTRAV